MKTFHSNFYHLIDMLTKFRQNHSHPTVFKRSHLRCPSMFTFISMYSHAHVAHSRKTPHKSLCLLNSLKMHYVKASGFHKQTYKDACSTALLSRHILSHALNNCEGSHVTLCSTCGTKADTMSYLSVEPLCGYFWPQTTYMICPPLPT